MGITSGIDPAFQPSIWPETGVMSATIRTVSPLTLYFLLDSGPKLWASIMKTFESYEVFYPIDHEFINAEILPSFYHQVGNDYRVTQLMMSNNILKMNTFTNCAFCTSINDNGDLGIH